MRWLILALLATPLLTRCGTTTSPEVPQFVERLIEEMESAPPRNPPGAIWSYQYRGGTVYYVPPHCCDIASLLYDADGDLLCSPDGGLTGRGDDRCPDFRQERSQERLIWRDDR